MSTTTARYGMTKPDPADTVDITKLNADLDTIDNALGSTPCTSTTRPSTPVNGQIIYETDTRRAYVYAAAITTWQAVGPLVAAIAIGGDQTVNNTVTLTNATALTIPVAVNTNYIIEGALIYSASTAADMQFNLTVPASGSYIVGGGALLTSATATSGSIERAAASNVGWAAGGVGVGTLAMSIPSGYVQIKGAAGNVQLQFAQNTADATNATLYGGSWIKLTRV